MRTVSGRNLLVIGAMLALGAGVAHGKECKGVSFPEQAQVEAAI
jgi:hypothetical protein